ncbi:unnamed protein product [Lepidochelys kempii]
MMETTSNKGVRQHPLLPAPMGLITFMRKGGKWPGWLQKEWGKQTAEPHPGTHNSSEETLVAKPFPSQGRKEPEPAARGTFDWPQLPSAGRKRGTSSNQDEQRTVPLLSCREQTAPNFDKTRLSTCWRQLQGSCILTPCSIYCLSNVYLDVFIREAILLPSCTDPIEFK